MADSRQRKTLGTQLRFLARIAGLTGLLVFALGELLLYSDTHNSLVVNGIRGLIVLSQSKEAIPLSGYDANFPVATAQGGNGAFAQTAIWIAIIGLAFAVLWLFAEAGRLVQGAGSRTAAGTTAMVRTVSAIALLIFVNAYAFTHHTRFDLTKSKQFTLAPELAQRLRSLRTESPTTIVVLQNHNIFGSLSNKRDSFTKAAEEKVAEKVHDLVDLFRELGPRFNVAVLDTEAFGYDQQLAELTKDSPELKAAIDDAPENSIFFYANKRVQRLGFNEFLQLDKTASRAGNDGHANLVLLPQGTENFARRVLSVQERRPKVAVCVVHELLTTEFAEGRGKSYTLAGLRKALTEGGYDVIDVVMKKNWGGAGSLDELKPAADTRAESKLERLEGELATSESELTAARAEARLFEEVMKRVAEVKTRPWEERSALYRKIVRGEVTEDTESQFVTMITRSADRAHQSFEEAQKDRRTSEERLKEAMKDERPLQNRRMSDVKEKLTRVLADVDMLIIPRFTVEDATEGPDVTPNLHALSKEQVEVIKGFMAKGKPVLACLGPITPSLPRRGAESAEDFERRLRTSLAESTDGFEQLITERGIELGRDLVLFDGESRAFAARRAGKQFGGGVSTDIPPLTLVETPMGVRVDPNPVAAAARLTARSVEQKLDLRMRALRPVYLANGWQSRLPFAAEFAFTSAESWNEIRPFLQFRPLPDGTVTATDLPRYDPTPLDDPKKGTRDEERRGPFPIGVAIESKVPASWLKEDYTNQQAIAAMLTPYDSVMAVGLTVAANQLDRPKQRLVVFGSGNIFSGPKLEPAQERLLLHSANWLTGREDRLPRSDIPAWQFPRVEMSKREFMLWRLGTAVGLPLLAVFFGLMVMMMRRQR